MRLSSVSTQKTAKKPHKYNKQQVPQSIEIQCSKHRKQQNSKTAATGTTSTTTPTIVVAAVRGIQHHPVPENQ